MVKVEMWPDLAPLKFERRSADRWAVEGGATAFVLAGERFGSIVDLRLVDEGHAGVGAIASQPIWPGTPVSLGFERQGALAQRGEVVRCVPCGDGYRVGIRLLGRMAA